MPGISLASRYGPFTIHNSHLINYIVPAALVLAALVLFFTPAGAHEAESSLAPGSAHIFFSAGCADCWPYTEDVLLPALQAQNLATRPEIEVSRK